MLTLETTVATLVLDHPELAPVFQRHRIDFCCQGGKALAVACQERGLDARTVLGELEAAVAARRAPEGPDPRGLSTPALIAQIIATHHAYLREILPFVRGLAAKVGRVHGDHNPRLRELNDHVQALGEALVPHLDTEEQVLFPMLMSRTPDATSVVAELGAMHGDHLAVGELLSKIRDAAEGFQTPDWACNSYRTLFAELHTLEADILRHVHLENHVLMPRFV